MVSSSTTLRDSHQDPLDSIDGGALNGKCDTPSLHWQQVKSDHVKHLACDPATATNSGHGAPGENLVDGQPVTGKSKQAGVNTTERSGSPSDRSDILFFRFSTS